MRNNEPTAIKNVLQHMVDSSPHKYKLIEAAVICAWKEIMPSAVQKKTERIFLNKDHLFVQLNSSPLKHSLQINEDKIIERLAEYSLGVVIKKLVLL